MRLIAAICLVLLSALMPADATIASLDASSLDTWPRGVYYPWERHLAMAKRLGMDKFEFADRMLGELAGQYHVDSIWTVNIGVEDAVRLCEIAQKHDIGVMVSSVPIIQRRRTRSPESAVKAAQESFDAFGKLPAARAYVMPDEPRAWEMPWLNIIAARLRVLDPTRPAIAVTMTHDTEAAVRQPDIPVICTDIYPFGFPRDPNTPNTPRSSRAFYRACTSRLATMCRQAGKIPWVMPQCFCEIWGPWRYDENLEVIAGKGAYLHWRMPTVGEMRWQVWSALCQGVRGFFYFVLFPPEAPNTAQAANVPETWPVTTDELDTDEAAALLNIDGTPTPQMEVLANTYAKLERLLPTLKGIWPARFPIAWTEEPFECRTFHNPRSDRYYVVIVNNDTDSIHGLPVTFLPVAAKVTPLQGEGSLKPPPDDASGFQVGEAHLAEGDAMILEVQLRAGTRVGPVYLDDFSLANSQAVWNGARRVLRRASMGMGWRWLAVVEQQKDDPQRSGTIEYDLERLAGAWTAGESRYLVCDGRTAGKNWESLIVEAQAADGPYSRLMVDEPGRPVPLTPDVKRLRITLKGEAYLTGLTVISVTGGK